MNVDSASALPTPNLLSHRLAAGDPAAFDEAFRLFHGYLYALAVRYLKSPALAEDALQEVFLKLWLNRQRLDAQQSLRGFLAVAMRNQVLNMIRDEKRTILHHIDYHAARPLSATTTEDQLQLTEYTQLMNTAIAQLTPQRRSVFQLRTQQGLTNEEVAAQLTISVNTVKVHYQQATRFLRAFLRQHAGIESLLGFLLWRFL